MSDPAVPSDGAGFAAQDARESAVPPEATEPAAERPAGEQGQDLPVADQAPGASAQVTEGPVQLRAEELPSGKAIVARYGVLRSLGLFQPDLEESLRTGTKVVVRSERGLELADVVTNLGDATGVGSITREQLTGHLRCAGEEYPFYRNGRLLRLANAQDLIDQRHLAGSAHEEAQYCRKEIRELKLDMKLVTVEHLLGGERIIFYFSSENRVDFRELVRRLASQFRTRIEMRQVGARDEAKLVGDFERCGRPCCCQSFLKDLRPVSMRMAKMQKATLDPSKISGRCGRLMCCLRYEDAGYEELRAKLPRRNTFVRTSAGVVGKVTDTQVLTQLVRLLLADGSQAVVGNEEIAEHNVPPPPPETLRAPAAAMRPMAWPSRTAATRAEEGPFGQADMAELLGGTESDQAAPALPEPTDASSLGQVLASAEASKGPASRGDSQETPEGQSGSRRRRRHHRKPPRGPQDGQPSQPQPRQAPSQPQLTAPTPSPGPPQQAPGSGERRRRRRRRRRH
ncbi:MAG: hypothetical protein MUP47_01615 [Phycisphaerae bacterium]|nr:hypothetical protein [Phycisphaerae bacterium]